MNLLLNDLTISIKDNNEESITENLQAIISQGNAIELKSTASIQPLFTSKCKKILRLTAEAIAEIAKLEGNRKVLTSKEVTNFLLDLFKYKDVPLLIQACRGLGNICFENECAREVIGKDGLKILISAIDFCRTANDFKLQTVICGFLLNLLMGNDELQKIALECNVLNLLEDILKQQLPNIEKQEDCVTHILLAVNMILDHMMDTHLSESFCHLLVDILKISQNPEVSVLCLEVIHGQSENSNNFNNLFFKNWL